MRLAVIADTHIPARAADLPPRGWRLVEASDGVLHAGDVTDARFLGRLAEMRPTWAVRGNNDTAAQLAGLPERLELELGGVALGLVHDTRGAAGRRRRLRRWFPRARVVVFGHSHIPVLEDGDGLLLLNPGSPTDRRRMPTFTMALLELSDGEARAELVDLGRERAARDIAARS